MSLPPFWPNAEKYGALFGWSLVIAGCVIKICVELTK